MKTHARLLLAVALSLCGFAAQAQSAAPEAVAVSQQDMQATPPKASDDPHCLRYTGSLITASRNARDDDQQGSDAGASSDRGRCIYSSGRAYSQDDLRRTGETDIGRALQMLDPSVTVGH